MTKEMKSGGGACCPHPEIDGKQCMNCFSKTEEESKEKDETPHLVGE